MRYYVLITAVLLILIFFGGHATGIVSKQQADIANQSIIPNLTGTWDIQSEGSTLPHSGTLGEWTHREGNFTTTTARAVITQQHGRVFNGTISAPLGRDESFIGVISPDNQYFHIADMDGFYDGKIISNDRMDGVYRHVKFDTVVEVGTWSRVL